MSTVRERLEEVYQAGRRRDYAFYGQRPYDDAEAFAFEAGLRDSLRESPAAETTFRWVALVERHYTADELRWDEHGRRRRFLQCAACGAICDGPTAAGGRCPACNGEGLAAMDDAYMAAHYPDGFCAPCARLFLLADALPGARPGARLCPRCGTTHEQG